MRDAEREAAEREMADRAAEREARLEAKRIEAANVGNANGTDNRPRQPKLPPFIDGVDQLDGYLTRFETFARISKWPESDWAVSLSALLSGRALEVYSRMPYEDALVYQKVKEVLLKRYNLTEEGYRNLFRKSKPQADESPSIFIGRIRSYLSKWIILSDIDKTFDGLRDLIVKEQFMAVCPEDLVIYLRERNNDTLEEVARVAELFLEARNRSFNYSPGATQNGDGVGDDMYGRKVEGQQTRLGQRKWQSRAEERSRSDIHCFVCHRVGHIARYCPSSKEGENASVKRAAAAHAIPVRKWTDSTYMVDKSQKEDGERKLKVVEGFIGSKSVEVLRDTGCEAVIVKRHYVRDDQLTGEIGLIRMLDTRIIRGEKAIIDIRTPYLSGRVKAVCVENSIVDLIVGNVHGVRSYDDPDMEFKGARLTTPECGMVERSQCEVTSRGRQPDVNRRETKNSRECAMVDVGVCAETESNEEVNSGEHRSFPAFHSRPTTKSQVRRFLGLTGYHRDVPNYATLAYPLTSVTKRGQPDRVKWGKEQEEAYDALKRAITTRPILHKPNMQKSFVLRAHASDVGLGVTLLQEDNRGILHPVAFASRNFFEREINYSTIEKQCLAIVWAVKRFKHYLYGKLFVLQTDQQPLKHLTTVRFVSARITRWAMFLQNYSFSGQ